MLRHKGIALVLALIAAPAFAANYLTSRSDRGLVRDNDIHNSITVNPFGFFAVPGVDLKYERTVTDKWSGLIGARVQPSRDVNPFALTLGADYFLLGRRNEGLYLGPRLQLGLFAAHGTVYTGAPHTADAGRALSDAFTGAGTYRDAVGGEVGYNFVSHQGLTLGLGGGLDYGFGSALARSENLSRWEPYAVMNVGLSW